MTALTIDVTQSDIVAGRQVNPWFCPIGLAAARAVGANPEDRLVGVVTTIDFMVTDGTGLKVLASVQLPQEANQFRIAFDAGDPVEPFPFVIEVPDEVLSAYV